MLTKSLSDANEIEIFGIFQKVDENNNQNGGTNTIIVILVVSEVKTKAFRFANALTKRNLVLILFTKRMLRKTSMNDDAAF